MPYYDPIAPYKPTPVELFLTGQSGPDVQPIRLLQNLLLPGLALLLFGRSAADVLADTVVRIKPSIVAVGTHVPLRGSSQDIRRTGFVVAGHYAVSNVHTVPEKLDTTRLETVAIFLPVRAGRAQVRVVSLVGYGRELGRTIVERLDRPFGVYQLDAVAYPGNSGSPVYDPDTGRVIGVINSTAGKETKEAAMTNPSGVSCAIPVRHVRALLVGAGVKG